MAVAVLIPPLHTLVINSTSQQHQHKLGVRNDKFCRPWPLPTVPTLSTSHTTKVQAPRSQVISSDYLSLPSLSSYDQDASGTEFEYDIYRWLNSSRIVQWYPGHIAKAEKELKRQLKLMDLVIEVRDVRIPLATGHPEVDLWIKDKKKIVVLNRVDMVTNAEKNAWAHYFNNQGLTVVLANGKLGSGTMKLGRIAKSLAKDINDKRRAKGLLPRAVRAGVIGYPNVGKSSLINRLLKRRVCDAAAKPGVTRELKWIRVGKELDLLDSPGILPMRISDQVAATKLAICDDIGEKSYSVTNVSAVLIEILKRMPSVGDKMLTKRYKIDSHDCSGETYVKTLGLHLFRGDTSQAAYRVLQDFRRGKFGWVALEKPSWG